MSAESRREMPTAVAQNSEDRFSNILFYGVVLCLAYLVFLVFQPFLVPLGLGGRIRGHFLLVESASSNAMGTHANRLR